MMKHIRNLRNNTTHNHTENSPPPQSSSASPIKRTNSAKRNTAPFAEVNGRTDTSPVTGKTKAPLPPRPPGSNAVKRKLGSEFGGGDGGGASGSAGSTDTGVQVIVRMRPPNSEDEGELIVQKTSGDTLSILGQPFTFDSVADVASTQADIFHLVGAPLVENCLSGFNSSVFAYGQTGSGKTYTMWGPANALSENELTSDQQGLTPRVFERLFSRINEEQQKHADKQLVYQCRCSFLEIYNEQITDLLNPAQGNLLIREDTKTGLYVENLTEEPVCSIKEVTRLLKKGLSNRRTGATSINMESSRSHSVFTCVVESRGKSVDGLSSFKTSRINLVDLAGSERQKLTRAAGDRLKEAGNINRSLSQLGNLINILAEVSQTGKQRHIPYRDSKLTFLLQESLGGNAKLAMVCAISPVESCRSETYSTLRFAQRAKAIKNKAVVNEEMQVDVKSLREVIRQLKDELQRMKENGNQTDPGAGYSTGWNARRSLNLLKFSLNHPLMQPRMDEDNDEEMEIDDEAEHVILAATEACKSLDSDNPGSENRASLNDANISLIPSEVPVVLKSPTSSASPRVTSSNRQSLQTSSTLTASQNDLASFSTFAATNRLAASLHHGLEVIDKHRKSSILGRSSFRSSYKPVVGEPKSDRKEVGVQTISTDSEFLCSNCKGKNMDEVKEIKDGSDLQLVPVNESPSDLQLVPVNESPSVDNNSKQIVPKKVEKVLAGAIRREMALEEFCTKQHTEIMQLNRLVQQYQHERECNSIIGQLQEDKIARLENLMEGVLSAEDFVNEELISLADNNKILKEKYENHPEILRKEMELKSVQEELERYKNYFDMGERDVLMEEIVDLRSQLQSYMDCSPKLTKKQTPVLQITYGESAVESAEQKLESERIRFTETESKWITLVEELKCELEANRLLCEKQKQELDIARKCSSEQKEAMQMAMQVHARLLENYADLQEKHMDMLINKRKIQDGIEDIKKAAARAGVKGAESRFINALASELSTLKVEREKERKRFRDENKGLQEQLRDTAEAVEAAGELLVRLKEAEEAVAAAQARAAEAEQEAENAYKQIEKLRKKQKVEVSPPPIYDTPIFDKGESSTTVDQHPIADLNNFCNMDTEELTTLPEPSSWFSGYDRCNI